MRKKKRKWPGIVIKALLALVLAGSVSLVLVDKLAPDQEYIPQSIVKVPGQIVSTVFKPLQGAFAWASQGVSDYLESWKLQKTIEIAYNQLKADNDDLSFKALRVEELEAEVESLRALNGRRDELQAYSPLLATVIGKEPGNWFKVFTIDVGKEDNVQMYMAVVNSEGLVGYISKVNETTSEVTTILDSRASVPGVIRSSNSFGSIKGTLGIGGADPACRMYYLPSDYIARPNDEVVTSGVGVKEDGTAFPKGLLIGVVRESSSYLDNNNRYVVVEPKVDFQRIEHVYVLVYKPDPEDIPNINDHQISSVNVVLDTARPYPSVMSDQLSDPNLGAVTPPPRSTRDPGVDTSNDPFATPVYGATPSPNPEMEQWMRENEESDLADQDYDPLYDENFEPGRYIGPGADPEADQLEDETGGVL